MSARLLTEDELVELSQMGESYSQERLVHVGTVIVLADGVMVFTEVYDE